MPQGVAVAGSASARQAECDREVEEFSIRIRASEAGKDCGGDGHDLGVDHGRNCCCWSAGSGSVLAQQAAQAAVPALVESGVPGAGKPGRDDFVSFAQRVGDHSVLVVAAGEGVELVLRGQDLGGAGEVGVGGSTEPASVALAEVFVGPGSSIDRWSNAFRRGAAAAGPDHTAGGVALAPGKRVGESWERQGETVQRAAGEVLKADQVRRLPVSHGVSDRSDLSPCQRRPQPLDQGFDSQAAFPGQASQEGSDGFGCERRDGHR